MTTAGERALDSVDPSGEAYTDIERFGRVLFSDYALSFEITAALLTIAVIGAVVLTRSLTQDQLLDDLEPDDLSLPAAAPLGANDSDPAPDVTGSGEPGTGAPGDAIEGVSPGGDHD